MKKNGLFFFVFAFLIGCSLFIFSRESFLDFASEYKILGGFIKFFVLASIGDLLSSFLKHKRFHVPSLFFVRAVIWGFIGILIVLMFPLYSSGVETLFSQGLLPFESDFTRALFTSILMNITFGAMMMLAHFTSDGYLDRRKEHVSLINTMKELDYAGFINRTFFKVIPLFWIPAHTITFLLPNEYRVLFAATLGIALGFLLGVAKRGSTNGND